ncbi:hypothetical protein R1sor_025851 [Riccia sorocarpa]|uniref:Uncharacterized protein n=1 Tax=Riccia sorocarpa TaxID=122646 RepID=A0ABD3G9S2_9MARC
MSLHLMLKKMIAPRRKKKPRKKTSVDVLPSQVKTRLHMFHCAKHGEIAPQRLEPLEILRIKDISQYQLTLDEKLSCNLFGLSRLSAFSEGQRPEAALLDGVPAQGAGEDFVEEKGTASAAIQTNIKIKAPQWGFVGMASPDGSAHVHPVCKRRGFCNRMLNNFSSEGSTVLDFFSGGVFAREALMLKRDVIYFASQEEAEFIGKYGKSLLNYSERVKHSVCKVG